MRLDKFLFPSKALGNERTIRVLSPENPRGPYPVLYVHDGLCAFRKDTPASYECFSFDEALIKVKREMIIVSLEAMEPPVRTREYSPFPWVGPAEKYLPARQEEGELYLEWLVHEVKPFIDAHYPTIRDRSGTFMFGTSLGGLISLYAAARYPDVFSKIGCFSLASWGNEKALKAFVGASGLGPDSSFFLRVGLLEGIPRDLTSLGECYPRLSEDMAALLKEKGSEVAFAINPFNRHCTKDWEKDVPSFILWLLS
jgi:Predicted hydrolase of the alpha/beta superfamily